uniref:Disease resistance R13L4/SHOC-2-like LRR domain-containing protein n=1 Tax=Ananas comosus var. bracteatus TaxID=296719 RepID=A0A6V7PKJ2_ANACO|nr:unnamed protein product [Ananas comosus var. bracteatus]
MKDAVYEAEDLLDEFGYLLLQSEVNSGYKVSLPSAFFSPVGISFRNKLKKVLSKLDKVKDCAQAFLDIVGATVTTGSSSGVASAPQQRPTSAFPLENQFFGRKEERGRILQWLLESGDQSEILLSVVGDGGVGKTTLAQSIYNETKVADRFELRIGVCVSANFNELRLTREILSLACDDLGNDSASFNLNKLQEQLQKSLRSIRVLDLTECKMEQLPKAAGKLIHLRYLAFAETPKTAPSSIYRLYYLQVLDVSRSRLPTLYPKGMLFPEGMDKLINLRVLHVPGAFTSSQIARIGKLTSLQRLAVFRTSKKKGRKIVELQNMNELRGSLRIMNLENVHSMQEAAEAKLNRKGVHQEIEVRMALLRGDEK